MSVPLYYDAPRDYKIFCLYMQLVNVLLCSSHMSDYFIFLTLAVYMLLQIVNTGLDTTMCSNIFCTLFI